MKVEISAMSADVERLRNELYEQCGKSRACKRAVDYYIIMLQNPCYPVTGMTYKVRKFYREIVAQHGPPPGCNVKALVIERLKGTVLEEYAEEAAGLAERIRSLLRITSRVAAAVATIVVAEAHGIRLVRESVAARFGVSVAAVRMHFIKAYRIYKETAARKA